MARMIVQIRRKPGMDDAAFYGHWQSTHGSIVRAASPATGAIRYVQAHRIPSAPIDGLAALHGWQPAPDGIAELWWSDTDAMLAAATSEAAMTAGRALRADESLFTESSGLRGVMTIEETVFDDSRTESEPGATPVKMVSEVWKRPGLSDADFHGHWRGRHADLVHELRKATGLTRYVQSRRDRDFPIDFAAARGWLPSPDGISEVWWPSERAMKAAHATPAAAQAGARLAASLKQFTDPARMTAFLAVERTIFDWTTAA